MRRRQWVIGLVLAFCLLSASLWGSSLYQGLEALLTLFDLIGQASSAGVDIRPAAKRASVEFDVEGRHYRADLYRPEDRTLAGVVFVPGAAHQGKDDPRVISLATILARARFAVLIPDVVALRELKLLPETSRDVADAIMYLSSQPDLVPEGRLGILTTSVAIGPAVLAMLDRSVSKLVRFILAIGGYYDLPRTLTYLTTGHYDAHGISLRNQPNEYGKWIYALSNATRIEDAQEREIFNVLAHRKLQNPKDPVDDLVSSLGPKARRIYKFIDNKNPALSLALMDALPAAQRDHIAQLNLAAHDLKRLKTRFILVHGLDDPTIPYGESIALASALAPGQSRLFLLRGLVHVDVAPEVMDGFRMWSAIYALLSERYRDAGAISPD